MDLLTQREFEQGFGSHTPMYSGQTKCVRYYMNFSRAMDLAKECLLEVSAPGTGGLQASCNSRMLPCIFCGLAFPLVASHISCKCTPVCDLDHPMLPTWSCVGGVVAIACEVQRARHPRSPTDVHCSLSCAMLLAV